MFVVFESATSSIFYIEILLRLYDAFICHNEVDKEDENGENGYKTSLFTSSSSNMSWQMKAPKQNFSYRLM